MASSRPSTTCSSSTRQRHQAERHSRRRGEGARAAAAARGHRLVPTQEANVRKDESPRFDPAGRRGDRRHDHPARTRTGSRSTTRSSTAPAAAQPIGGLVDGATYYVVAGRREHACKLADDKGGAGDRASARCGTGTLAQHRRVRYRCRRATRAPSARARSTTRRSRRPSAASRSRRRTATTSPPSASAPASRARAAVNLSGVVNVTTVEHVGAHRRSRRRSTARSSAATCTNPGANADQSVRVAAGNHYFELGVVAALAIGGGAGVGVGAGVRILELNTDA